MSETPETDSCPAERIEGLCGQLERERAEAIQERERWRMQAEQKWGMRRELEELLGVKDTQCNEQFAKGVAVLRDLIKDRDEARREQSSIQCAFEDSQDKIEQLERERDEAREALREIQAAVCGYSSGELRGMARKALEDAK